MVICATSVCFKNIHAFLYRTIRISRLIMNLPSQKGTDPTKIEHQYEIITLNRCLLWARNSWLLGLWDCGIKDALEDLRRWLYRLWYTGILKLYHLLQVLERDVQPLWKGTAAPTVCYRLPYGSERGDPAAGGRTRGPRRSKTHLFLFVFLCLFLDNHCSMKVSHNSGYMNRSNIAISYF